MKPLDGKTAIVTGVSAPNGIGRATAVKLSQEGASVIVTDISGSLEVDGVKMKKLDLLRNLADEIRVSGGTATALEVDVSKKTDIDHCIHRAEAEYGQLDILVNNAGTLAGTGAFLDSKAEDWITSFEVNLLGVMLFCQAAIHKMRNVGGGSIVNVGSTGSLGAEAGFGAYTTMKHGLIGLTKTIAAEFGGDRIRCNAVCPGYTNTDMHMATNARLALERNEAMADIKAERYSSVALQRAGTPQEVAAAIAYLAGPSSSYVTGVALPVAGGVPYGI